MVAEVWRHTDIQLSFSANDACGGPSACRSCTRPAESDGFAGAFADSIIYGHRDLGEEGRAAISWKNLLASVSFLATGDLGQLGFPSGTSVRHAESFEDAGEIVGAPAVTQYERNRDGLWVLAHLQFAWRLPEQLLEAVIHVQLLEENLHQGRRPPERSGGGNRRTNGPRSNIPAPAFRRLRLSEQGYAGSCLGAGRDLSAPTSERVIGDFVSGDFRREGMGAPGIGDSPPHLTASRPVPAHGRPYRWQLRAFWRIAAGEGWRFGYAIPGNVIDREGLCSRCLVNDGLD